MTQPCHKDTALNQQCCDSKHKGGRVRGQNKKGETIQEGREQCERGEPNPKIGHHSTYCSRHSIEPQDKQQGGRQHTDGGSRHSTGSQQHHRPSLTMPPTIHNGTPPSTTAPPSTTTRGGNTQRIPHHTNTTNTHPPPTHHTPGNGTVHDMTAVLASTAMGWVGRELHHRTGAGQQHHTPPPFRTPRRMDTIHSSTHLLSLIHVHTTDDQR